MVGAVDGRHSHGVFGVFAGTRDEQPAFAGIKVRLKNYVAAGDVIAHSDNTFHMAEHLLRIVNVALHVVGIVQGGHFNQCRYAALLSLNLTQNTQITSLGLFKHVFLNFYIHHTSNDNHHCQNHRHDAISESFRQSALHITSIIRGKDKQKNWKFKTSSNFFVLPSQFTAFHQAVFLISSFQLA